MTHDATTRRLLVDAGIAPGMRVIDIGCGSGDVSLLLADLVGETGHVLGIDRAGGPLDAALQRVRDLKIGNVDLVQSDLSGALPDGTPYDALVGRRVLMDLPDPVDVIRRFAATLLSGGVAVFQEHDSTMVPGRLKPLPLHDRVLGWLWRTVEREGANIHMGLALPSVLERAGLRMEHVRAEAVIQGQSGHHPLQDIVRAMLPRMVRHSVVREAEVDLDTLEHRLSAERRAAGLTYVSDMAFGAWARKP